MRIAILADDITGAAELASAAADTGFSAEVQTRFDPESSAEVIAVDSDTRNLLPAEAAAKAARLVREILGAGPEWIYKKTDSVLRGNVRAELEAILQEMGATQATLIPANPSKGRTIQEGIYRVNGALLSATAFANDPDHPRQNSRVLDLLGAGRHRIASVRAHLPLPQNAISVPDVSKPEQLDLRALETAEDSLAAGGVEFFQALLKERTGRSKFVPPAAFDGKALHVCGSAHAWEQGRFAQCQAAGIPVFPMPDPLYGSDCPNPEPTLSAWVEATSAAITNSGRAMISIGRNPQEQPAGVSPTALAGYLASAAAQIVQAHDLGMVYIEGGATGGALLKALNWTRLAALPSSSLPGVAALRSSGASATLLLKPGSYPWPDSIWASQF